MVETASSGGSPPEVRRDAVLEWAYRAVWVLVAGLFLLRFWGLEGDFIAEKEYSRDGVLYTDEGWYANNAIRMFQTGAWHYPGDLNFAVNLPVLQVMHVVSFALFGMEIASARVTVIACFAALLAMIHGVLLRRTDRWTALLAVLVVCWNFFFFQFSRFAIAELPMAMLACGGFLLAWRSGVAGGCRPCLVACSLGAGVLWALALLTKTSALFALPITLAIACAANWRAERRGDRWLAPALALAGAGVVWLLHWVLLARNHAEDYSYFHTLNVGMRMSTDPQEVGAFFLHMVDKMELIDDVLYRVLKLLPLGLLLFVRDFRRDPLVLFSIAYFLIYSVMFSFYVNLKPRYWSPLVVPFALLVALCMRTVALRWREHHLWKALTVGMGLALAASFGENVKMTAEYLREQERSFAEMAADVKQRMGSDRLLLGHFSTTLALYVDVLPMNDRYSARPLAERLEAMEQLPRWLLTEDTILRGDAPEERENNYPGSRVERLEVLRRHYRTIEEVAVYDVFENYKDYRIHLYRLEE